MCIVMRQIDELIEPTIRREEMDTNLDLLRHGAMINLKDWLEICILTNRYQKLVFKAKSLFILLSIIIVACLNQFDHWNFYVPNTWISINPIVKIAAIVLYALYKKALSTKS